MNPTFNPETTMLLDIHTDTDAPISHFANCHTGILAQLARLGDLPVLLGPAAQARKIAQESLVFFNDALFNHHSEEEKDLIRGRKWIEMIRRGVIFFVLEKMAAVLGVPNPAVYAAFRGETLAEFLATRKLPITYSVAGGDKVKAMDKS